MLEWGIIKPSSSEWCSPMVIVKKKDGALRICVDYQRLNSILQVDTYPIPRIDDVLDWLGHLIRPEILHSQERPILL